MVCHWLIDSNSTALSSQHPQTLRFFPREVKNINHDRYFPQGLERLNPDENYIRTREQLAELTASRGGVS
jgi:serine/threonine-protein kinase RIO1